MSDKRHEVAPPWGFHNMAANGTMRGVGEVRAGGMSVPSCVGRPGVLQRVQLTVWEPFAL